MQLLYSFKLFSAFRFCPLKIFRFFLEVTRQKGLEVCTRAVPWCFNAQAFVPFFLDTCGLKPLCLFSAGEGVKLRKEGSISRERIEVSD
jgi:hypothetical protein